MSKVYPKGNNTQHKILKLKYDAAIQICRLHPEVKVCEVLNKR